MNCRASTPQTPPNPHAVPELWTAAQYSQQAAAGRVGSVTRRPGRCPVFFACTDRTPQTHRPKGSLMTVSPTRFRIALAVGTLSSVLLTLASYVIAPLGSAAALWHVDAFQSIRASGPLAVVATITVTVAGFALIASWLAVSPRRLVRGRARDAVPGAGSSIRHTPDAEHTPARTNDASNQHQAHASATAATPPTAPTALGTRRMLLLTACWAAPLLFALPLTSQDVYSYIAVGHLTAAGGNPYTTGVNVLPGWQALGIDPVWAATPTPYGPVLLAVGWLVVTVTAPLGLLGAIAGFRLVMLGGLVIAAWMLIVVCRFTGAKASTALWVALANPLTLISCVLAIHNDALVVAAVAAGLVAAHRGSISRSWAWVVIAAAMKPTAAIAAPAMLRISRGDDLPWRRRATHLAWMAAGGVAVLAALAWVAGSSLWQWLGAVASTPHMARPLWFAPVQMLTGWSVLAPSEGSTPAWATLVVTIVGGLSLVAAAAIAVWPTRRPAASQLALAYAVFLAGSSVIWPWYVVLALVAIAASVTAEQWIPTVAFVSILFATQSLSAGFFDTSALPAAVVPAFNVLPGVLGVLWMLWLGTRIWVRRRRSAPTA